MTTRALKSKAGDIDRIARSHGVSRVRVFGSHAAGRDVVTENGLSPYLRRTILRTAKSL